MSQRPVAITAQGQVGPISSDDLNLTRCGHRWWSFVTVHIMLVLLEHRSAARARLLHWPLT